MTMRTCTVAAVLALGVAALGTPTAAADPEPTISYRSQVVDNAVVTTLVDGTFLTSADGRFVAIEDRTGTTVLTMPLTFQLDHVSHPYAYQVTDAGATLALTPDMDPALARPVGLVPVASEAENWLALQQFGAQVSIASTIGGFTGGLLGATAGLLLGFSAGIPTGPGALLTALGGVGIGSLLGTVAGTIIAGGAAILVAGFDLISTVTAPPGTTRWAN